MKCLTKCAYKVKDLKFTYALEVFMGTDNADPFIRDEWIRTEVKFFDFETDAIRYLKDNYSSFKF